MSDSSIDIHSPAALAAGGIDKGAENLELIRRRQAHLGGSMLFYRDPVQIVRGEGVWLYDQRGRRYLDCYNNVASVGHCHPRVVNALCNQARQLNTHTRYLHSTVVDYAEKLAASFPGKLDACLFVCTGTEANELAMRIARAVSGKQGAVVMENSYHGNSNLINEMSTALVPIETRSPHVAAVEPPNCYRGPFRGEDAGERYAALVDEAIARLQDNGSGIAAFMCDSIFDTQGVLEAPADYFQQVYRRVREAGGLCIADEVQAGLARTGKMWGFEHYGVEPDIVTLGKPMGDGHPIGAVVTRWDILDHFCRSNIYFNTFGGNPVSAAVGNAVLDVVHEEGLLTQVDEVGAHLRRQLEALRARHPLVGDVRGLGLFLGVELVRDRDSREPATQAALAIAERMRDEGVLIGATGRHGNVIKIRPPLVFSREHADHLVDKFDLLLAAASDGLLTQSDQR